MESETYICTLISNGVEVVTAPVEGGYLSTVNGGKIDGQTFFAVSDPEELHRKSCLIARMTAWPRKLRRAG